jgi:hypothetical protein
VNTFAGIGFSFAFSLLALGGYLIEQQFANPLEAQSLGLTIAALFIATAVTLLCCLLRPFRRLEADVATWPAPGSSQEKNVAVSVTGSRAHQAADTPLAGRYVDRTRIRIEPLNGNQARGIAGK